VGFGFGVGDKYVRDVSRMAGGTPILFSPKLSTLSGAGLGTEGEVWASAERIETNEYACSGESVIVVGGRVSVGCAVEMGVEVMTCPGRVPWSLQFG